MRFSIPLFFPPPPWRPLIDSDRGPAAILFISRDACSDSIARGRPQLVGTFWQEKGHQKGRGFSCLQVSSSFFCLPFSALVCFFPLLFECLKPKIAHQMRSSAIARLFRACFYGVSRDTLQNGISHRCACVKLSTRGEYP